MMHKVDENVGRHEVGKVVYFQPDVNSNFGMKALVVRNRGVEGKVLYDIALQVEGGEFYTVLPLKEVDSFFVNDLPK